MSIFNKEISELTYSDLAAFLDSNTPECQYVDYKKDFPSDLAKSVAAMANSIGGLVLIGIKTVGEVDNQPGLPGEISGINNPEQLTNKTEKKCGNLIYPPILPETAALQLPDDSSKFVFVVRVQPSQIAPHWYEDNSQQFVPIRVNDFTVKRRFTRGVTPEELEALRGRRKPLVERYHRLKERASERCLMRKLLEKAKVELEDCERSLGRSAPPQVLRNIALAIVEVFVSPEFPYAPIASMEEIMEITKGICSYTNLPAGNLRTAHETAYLFASPESRSFWEITKWGSVHASTPLSFNPESATINIYHCFQKLSEAMATATHLFRTQHYMGRIKANVKVSRSNFRLFFDYGSAEDHDAKQCPDLEFNFDSEFFTSEMADANCVKAIFRELLYCLGFGYSERFQDLIDLYYQKHLEISKGLEKFFK